jgi:murein DD-endopeptidase MepM/ murein hydrolase activator NlpD
MKIFDFLKRKNDKKKKPEDHLGAMNNFLDQVDTQLDVLLGLENLDGRNAHKVLKVIFHLWRVISREERTVHQEIEPELESLSDVLQHIDNPKLREEGQRLLEKMRTEDSMLVRWFSRYTGQFGVQLEKVRDEDHLIESMLKKDWDISTEKETLHQTIKFMESTLHTLQSWILATIATLQQSTGINRRDFLKRGMVASAAGLAVLRAPALAHAAGALAVKYVTFNNKYSLRIKVNRGMGYSHIAEAVTAKETNWPRIKKFNGNKKLAVGVYVHVEVNLVTPELQQVLRENKFRTFTIQGGGSLAFVMQQVVDQKSRLFKRYGYIRILNMLLVINDANLARTTFQEGENVIIPESILQDISERQDDDPPEKPLVKVKPKKSPPPVEKRPQKVVESSDNALINRFAIYQNPFRIKTAHGIKRMFARVEPRHRWHARRVRTGGIIIPKGHKGLDLWCQIGTPLYSMSVGQVVLAKDYKGAKYWRNGKAVDIKLPTGERVKYLHLSKIHVREGDIVGLNTMIGKSGISGNASASNPHVHIRFKSEQGVTINPTPYCRAGANYKGKARKKKGIYVRFFKKVIRRRG